MHRLFVAIRPPEAIRNQLLDLMEGVKGARWQDEDQLHLTLRFIGEVDRHTAQDIVAALGAIHQPRFELALSGLGTFDRRGQPVTLWAGVAPHEPLKALHKKVDQAVLRAGVEPDRRAYMPHFTLARLSRSTGPIEGLMEQSGGLSSPPFPVEEFRLYESDLTPQGAIYSVVERYGLD
jgi:RNA 2',3'-cyclic 3'-phosphodiesterase